MHVAPHHAARVAGVCAAEILGLAGYSLVPALLPQFMEAWWLSSAQAGWLAGIMFAGYMVAVVPLVSLTDIVPARRSAKPAAQWRGKTLRHEEG